jgi:hypothetical protein
VKHLVPVEEEEGEGEGGEQAGEAGVELQLGWAVPQPLTRDEHLRVHVLTALAIHTQGIIQQQQLNNCHRTGRKIGLSRYIYIVCTFRNIIMERFYL